jgi:putative ATP-dependent endonuclease of OLD family
VIERVIIHGYRRFADLDVDGLAGVNIVVGDNESGKSTLLEAIGLALTGRVNGRWAGDELNPFWFHRPTVNGYFAGLKKTVGGSPPEIWVEVYLRDDNHVQGLRGVHNSLGTDCPGVRVHVHPSSDYTGELAAYLAGDPPAVVPVEYYTVDWRDFSDLQLTQRPKCLATSFIDARTVRSSTGVDYHTRSMLAEHLDERERTTLALAHRSARQDITTTVLAPINARIAAANVAALDKSVGLQMDQSARTSWEADIVPQVDDIPFAMVGQGQQAAVKVALAMSRTAGASTYVLVEEPENHLSHTSLHRLLGRLQTLATDEQQLLITTHSSTVLNRLGLDQLLLLQDGGAARLTALDPGTVDFFRKLPGYDTLRLVLARKLALVEGPSDALVLERAIRDATNQTPLELGIDILSIGGTTFPRALELCANLDRGVVALRDNDGVTVDEHRSELKAFLDPPRRQLLAGDVANGRTLEPQIAAANDEDLLRRVLHVPTRAVLSTWMKNHKADCALHILDANENIIFPNYVNDAVALLT